MAEPYCAFMTTNQPTNQPRQRNNTNRSYCHRQRTTNHYPTQNKGNTNNHNQSDSESENQQQQQETTTATTNEIQSAAQSHLNKKNNLTLQQYRKHK